MERRNDNEADAIRVQCPQCATRFSVPATARKLRCRSCGHVFVLGNESDARTQSRKRGTDKSRPRKRSGRDSPSAARIVIGIFICFAAAILLVVGIYIVARATRNKAKEELAPPPIAEADGPLTIDGALRLLRSDDVFQQTKAVEALAAMKVDASRRAEVIAALRTALDRPLMHTPRPEMVDALGQWATADDVPFLLQLMNDKDGNVQARAMTSVGKLKDARAVEPLAKQLVGHGFRRFASQALKDMGPVAEPAVAEFLTHPDYGLRIEACGILKVIGPKTSEATLIRLAWDDHQGLAEAARDALPPARRPPIYGPAQIMYLNIHVPDPAAWPAIETKLRALAEGQPVLCKSNRSGEYMSVRLAPVTADPMAFAKRIDFGEIGSVQVGQRLIYVSQRK